MGLKDLLLNELKLINRKIHEPHHPDNVARLMIAKSNILIALSNIMNIYDLIE